MLRAVLLTVGAAVLMGASGGHSQVVINEIMYHDPTNDPAEEFLELHNAGPDPVNLGGWHFTDGIIFSFSSEVVIEPGGYLVLCSDSLLFRAHHPEVPNVLGNFTGRLSNGGERVTLCDDFSCEVDSVRYGDAYPWPPEADGGGPSLELMHPLLDNDQGVSWAGSTIVGGTPGFKNSVFSEQEPIADAGQEQYVPEGTTAFLDGTGSGDVDGWIVSFRWAQTGGPDVAVTGDDTATPFFDSPQVSENTPVTFELTVEDNDGYESSATVGVVVINVEGSAVGGALEADTTWDSAGSPYVVTAPLIVPGGLTLAIEPGVVVQMFPEASIGVNGVLAAEGTEEQPILFRRVPGVDVRWGYLRFDGASGSVLQHCEFEYGSSAGAFSSSIPERSAVYVTNSEMGVDHCTFRYFTDYVLTAEDSELAISHNTFYETGEAINLTRCVASVEDNLIEGVRNGDDAIDINADWLHPGATPVTIEGNVILRVSGDGIDLGECSPVIRGNLIYLCADKGISLGEGSGGRIENNILMMNDMGIAVKDASNPLILNNTIVKNGVGLSYYEKEGGHGGGRGQVVNCIVWGNDMEVSYDGLSLPNISYSIVGGETLWAGEGNLNEDPLFVDLYRNDFRLTEASPAVDSGASGLCPETDFAGETRPSGQAPDMGALERSDAAYDMDGDGVLDGEDAFPLDSRFAEDSDSDTLPDEWEMRFFGGKHARPGDDPDGDGLSNAEEYFRGTDPVGSSHASVIINEIHYHPSSEDSADEFIELYNRSSDPADISGWGITDEVLFDFPEGTIIPGNGYLVVAKEPRRIQETRGAEVVCGPYDRSLSNASGVVRLVENQQACVCQVSYSDSPPWPRTADGDGPSLELRQPDLDPTDAVNWWSSWVPFGTPGRRNSSIEGPVVINEFMASPTLGAGWIELFNTTDERIDLSGFYVSDDERDLTRYQIPAGKKIEAGRCFLVTELECGFGLAMEGETLFLTAPDEKTIWSQYHYSEQVEGVSQARHPNAGEDWYSYIFGSPGGSNPAPQLVGGVVINEVYYHPKSDRDAEEFVEVYNPTSQTVNLSGWAIGDGFGYHFPLGTLLPADSYLVIGNSPIHVMSLFGLQGVLGPFESGRLSNRGERIALHDHLGNLVDEVSYADSGAWPVEPDGDGASLELINPTFERNMPACWAASVGNPTPGRVNSVLSDNIPPQLVSLVHSPTIPTSADNVLVQARVVDHDGHVAAVAVFFKRDQDEQYVSLPMTPEGAGSDTYRAVLPPQPDGTLVEFYIRVEDDRGEVMVRPKGAPGTTSTETGRPITISYLYLVDEAAYTSKLPLYRLLLTQENFTEVEARPLESNIILSAGFVFGDQPFYDVGFRYREWSREARGVRIEFYGSQRLHDDRVLRLSRNGAVNETLSSEFHSWLGIPRYETIDINLLINREKKGFYVDTERINEDFLEREFPEDLDGNLARAWVWAKFFTLEEGESTEAFETLWNDTLWRWENDIEYPRLLEAQIDVDEWIRWFAATAILADWDTLLGPWSENHLEYERPSDGRIVIFSNDMDCTWISPRLSIEEGTCRSIDPRVQNFLRYPAHRRQYYQEIINICDQEFSPERVFPLIDDVCSRTGQTSWRRSVLKEYVTIRRAFMEYAIENYIGLSETFRPVIGTNGGDRFFTDAANVAVSGMVLPQSAGVKAFRVEGTPAELVTNGGFEDGTTGWEIGNSVPGILVSRDGMVRQRGTASIRIEMLSGNPTYRDTVQIVDCKPLTHYKVSFDMKAIAMIYGSVCLNISDADNGEEYLSVDVPPQRDNGPYYYTLQDCDWTHYSAVFATMENTQRLAVRIARIEIPNWQVTGDARGTVWFDNISLQEIYSGYELLGECEYESESGSWSTTLPLEPGKNVFDFLCEPVLGRPYLGMATRLLVYRSDDGDGDGLADAWEEESLGSLAWGPEDDPDGDEVENGMEFVLGTHPYMVDTDDDGIPDGFEVAKGLDPLTDNRWVDSDEDGQSDSQEYLAGTDLLDPDSMFAVCSAGVVSGKMDLVWHSVPGRTYQVSRSEDLISWTPIGSPVLAEDTVCSSAHEAGEGAHCFYRVEVVP